MAELLALMVAAADFLVVSPWLAPLSPQLLAQPYQTVRKLQSTLDILNTDISK